MSVNHSKQRDAIMTFLHSRKDHPTAEVIFENVKQVLPSISRGTVYRNLSLLEELGMIKALDTGDSRIHYDADVSPHYHFICKKCDAVLDVDLDCSKYLSKVGKALVPGTIDNTVVYYYGICKKCQENKN